MWYLLLMWVVLLTGYVVRLEIVRHTTLQELYGPVIAWALTGHNGQEALVLASSVLVPLALYGPLFKNPWLHSGLPTLSTALCVVALVLLLPVYVKAYINGEEDFVVLIVSFVVNMTPLVLTAGIIRFRCLRQQLARGALREESLLNSARELMRQG